MGESGSYTVKLLETIRKAWINDRLLRKVIRNTGYLFSSNSISAGLSSFQGILAALLLGPDGYGALGIIIGIVTNVNRLLSFRMTEVVIKYAGQYLANEERDKAAAMVKIAAIVEGLTSICAYAILFLIAPLAAKVFLKEAGEIAWMDAIPWIRFYGLIILANILTETSTAVLNIGGHFRTQAGINLAQSILVMVLILSAFVLKVGILYVLTAYLLGKFVIGLSTLIAALSKMKPLFGAGWWRMDIKILGNLREISRFAISTNLSGTVNLIIRDSEVLWVGLFLSTEAAGYYKFALAAMNVILMPITPFISTTYPEINRGIARKNWGQIRNLLKRTTIISGTWTAICGLGLVLAGPWLLGWLEDGLYLPSLPIMMVLFVGFGTANLLFWNRNLLLAFNQPNYPLKVTFLVGALKTILMFFVVKPFGAIAQGSLLSAYLFISVGLIALRGLRILTKNESLSEPGGSSG